MGFSYKKTSKIVIKFFKMIKRSYKTYTKKFNKSSIWLKLFLMGALILLFIKKYNLNNPKREGFSQMEKYVIKENDELYDDFYVDYYDDLSKDIGISAEETKSPGPLEETCRFSISPKSLIKDLEAFMQALVIKLIWGEFNRINLLSLHILMYEYQ